MKYKYFIWDVGGTLFDTLQTSSEAFAKTLKEFGRSTDFEQIYRRLKETSTVASAEFFVGQKSDEFLKRYHEIEQSMQDDPALFPDAAATLKAVVENGGKNYIVSNRDLQVVDFLEKKNLIQYLSYVLTRNDGFARKPSPEALYYLFDHFAVVPKETLMIGDREVDVLAAKSAGIAQALYSPDGLIKIAADYTITRLSEAILLG